MNDNNYVRCVDDFVRCVDDSVVKILRSSSGQSIMLAPRTDTYLSYSEAVLYCKFFKHSGFTDWRLPSRSEYLIMGMYNLSWWEKDDDPPGKKYVVPVRDV